MAYTYIQIEKNITVIFFSYTITGSIPNMNWSSLRTKPLSNLQRMTSNLGAKCPATLVYTPEKCILQAVILCLDHVLK